MSDNFDITMDVVTDEVSIDMNVDSDTDSIEINVADSGFGGTSNYNDLNHKPKINGVELIQDKSFEDLGQKPLTNIQILNIINTAKGLM